MEESNQDYSDKEKVINEYKELENIRNELEKVIGERLFKQVYRIVYDNVCGVWKLGKEVQNLTILIICRYYYQG